MSKSNKSALKNRQNGSRKLSSFIWVIAGTVILIVISFFVFPRKPSGFTPIIIGNPGLVTDKQVVDLGDVKLGQPVQVSFAISNEGDQALQFTETPYIEVKEGCWPPNPVIGSMTLKPGETTTLSMEFMMHGDMGGKHDFRVHIPNNDPNHKDITLTVLSNWVP